MNISSLKKQLEDTLDLINSDQEVIIDEKADVNGRYQIKLGKKVSDELIKLLELGMFNAINNFYKQHNRYFNILEAYRVQTNEKKSFYSGIQDIKKELTMIISILNLFIPENEGYAIEFKLPINASVEDLPMLFKNIETMLVPLAKHLGVDEELIIHSFENGSQNVSFSSIATSFMICMLTILPMGETAFAEINQLEEHNIEMFDNAEIKPEIQEFIDEQMEKKIEEKVGNIVNITVNQVHIEEPSSNPNEFKNVLRVSIKALLKLLKMGCNVKIMALIERKDKDKLNEPEIEAIERLNKTISAYTKIKAKTDGLKKISEIDTFELLSLLTKKDEKQVIDDEYEED